MICNPKATLQTLSDFNTDLKNQLNRLRESQREVILCGGEVDSEEIESNYTKTSITIGSRIEELTNLSKNKDKISKIFKGATAESVLEDESAEVVKLQANG